MTTTRTVTTTAVLDRDAPLPTASWQDWSCLVRLVVSDPDALTPAIAYLEAMMQRVDRAASRFRADSELSWANANPGRPVVVSRTMANLVASALREAARSDGAVDPTVGDDLVRLGYDRDIALVRDSPLPVGSGPEPVARPSWRDVRLDEIACLLTVPAGCTLDLGATAKAQTADWAAADLSDRFRCDVLVEIGGDLAVAGRKDDWQVTVAERVGQAGEQVTLGAGGIATSTTTIRRWRRGDTEISHLIDPATGAPAAGPWRTVTVAAGNATHANTCSTAAVVLGDGAVTWLGIQRVAARLVHQSGEVHAIGGWPC
ncbi:FAD:protein FMN transferase [Pengzhenrongella sp.]|jgi:thiamine biosynthesis lipoprotein|uniref:FAD:protein FMN transferase n=1 Tax=Pengzhenrongella sp. TaxID=2888820 RepID=UPI002F94F52D